MRVFIFKIKKTIPVYADNATSKYLLKSFGYCFKDNYNEYPATLNLNSIDQKIFIKDKNKKIKIIPIKVKHGMVESICYVIDKKLAYISDVSEIYKKDYKMLKKFKVFDHRLFVGLKNIHHTLI